jgi:hypothetical protein
MAQTNIINKFGRIIGWNQVQLVLFGRTLEGITEFSYDDEVEKEAVMGAGKFPIGTGEGTYKAKCSITVLSEEYNALMDSLPANTRIQDVPGTDVSVLYMRGDKQVKDVIRGFEFTGASKELKQGDKSIAMKLSCYCTHIDWNVQ